jgi:hypothetical protein
VSKVEKPFWELRLFSALWYSSALPSISNDRAFRDNAKKAASDFVVMKRLNEGKIPRPKPRRLRAI